MVAELIFAGFKEYGPIGAVAAMVVYLIIAHYSFKSDHKDDKAAFIMEVEKMRNDIDNKDIGCKVHGGYFEKTFERLDTLEKDIVRTDRDMKTVFNKLDGMDGKLDTIVLMFAKKGVDA